MITVISPHLLIPALPFVPMDLVSQSSAVVSAAKSKGHFTLQTLGALCHDGHCSYCFTVTNVLSCPGFSETSVFCFNSYLSSYFSTTYLILLHLKYLGSVFISLLFCLPGWIQLSPWLLALHADDVQFPTIFHLSFRTNVPCSKHLHWTSAAAAAKSPQWDPMDSSPPGSSVHGILQARILDWVAISFSNSNI